MQRARRNYKFEYNPTIKDDSLSILFVGFVMLTVERSPKLWGLPCALNTTGKPLMMHQGDL
jgi:hypothetical protein